MQRPATVRGNFSDKNRSQRAEGHARKRTKAKKMVEGHERNFGHQSSGPSQASANFRTRAAGRGQFRAVPETTSLLGTFQFALLPPRAFLYAFSHLELPSEVGDGKLCLSIRSSSLFQQLKAGLPQFQQAMKLFTKRQVVNDESDSGEA
ncbi:hypothetical protein FIBSPDRAFT_884622 [Athelia psychrophila]|uniref:Uncharacterized protein n=1 Tax=Athelia psychrophila TaxID=1759441 RepID=A0A166SY11_9AGAM|nr:hypothetical protein FIBSPDRAFT_884622 [Fibularhizoctonia sp. CBS 109695]